MRTIQSKETGREMEVWMERRFALGIGLKKATFTPNVQRVDFPSKFQPRVLSTECLTKGPCCKVIALVATEGKKKSDRNVRSCLGSNQTT